MTQAALTDEPPTGDTAFTQYGFNQTIGLFRSFNNICSVGFLLVIMTPLPGTSERTFANDFFSTST